MTITIYEYFLKLKNKIFSNSYDVFIEEQNKEIHKNIVKIESNRSEILIKTEKTVTCLDFIPFTEILSVLTWIFVYNLKSLSFTNHIIYLCIISTLFIYQTVAKLIALKKENFKMFYYISSTVVQISIFASIYFLFYPERMYIPTRKDFDSNLFYLSEAYVKFFSYCIFIFASIFGKDKIAVMIYLILFVITFALKFTMFDQIIFLICKMDISLFLILPFYYQLYFKGVDLNNIKYGSTHYVRLLCFLVNILFIFLTNFLVYHLKIIDTFRYSDRLFDKIKSFY